VCHFSLSLSPSLSMLSLLTKLSLLFLFPLMSSLFYCFDSLNTQTCITLNQSINTYRPANALTVPITSPSRLSCISYYCFHHLLLPPPPLYPNSRNQLEHVPLVLFIPLSCWFSCSSISADHTLFVCVS
jgi:hypothetical protein